MCDILCKLSIFAATCSTRHLGHSSLVTVDQASAPFAKTVSGTYCKLLEEHVTTYQERLESYLTKMLQHFRNILKVTRRRCYNVPETSCKLLDEVVTIIRNLLKVTWRRCYNVSGTSCKLVGEDVTMYQENIESYSKKMLQRIRNVLQVT